MVKLLVALANTVTTNILYIRPTTIEHKVSKLIQHNYITI